MNTVAVLVTHHPDLAILETVLAALTPQVAGLVLVDNGSGQTPALEALLTAQDLPVRGLFQPENSGLARAQNLGIAEAQAMGAGAVLLMDQDSQPAADMVAALEAALEARAGDTPAAIGAAYTEPHRGADAGLPEAGGAVPEMPALIASGTLIPCAVFTAVGAFDEALFIDFVDTEWCFRARARGYRCFAARAARMTHRIGDGTRQVLGRARPVHAPARAYYQTRNILVLARKPWVPRRWLWRVLPRVLARSLGLALIASPRGARLRAVIRGLWDGLRGQGGAMP